MRKYTQQPDRGEWGMCELSEMRQRIINYVEMPLRGMTQQLVFTQGTSGCHTMPCVQVISETREHGESCS